jgi:N-acetylmuramoyl-L-alanine amidase
MIKETRFWKWLSSIFTRQQVNVPVSNSVSEVKAPSSTPSSEPSQTSIKLKKGGFVKKLAIIVGHEKKKDGASALAPLSTTEYPFNKQVAEFMYVYARELQLDCKIVFRDGVGIDGAAKVVNEWKADCCIELHFNSASPSAYGTETLHDAEPSTNAEFAAIVQRHMCETLKREGKGNRGVKFLKSGDRGHYNLHLVKCTSCLVEPFFGSNKKDCELMWKNVTGYSRCMVNAAVEWLNKGEK